MKVKYIVFIIQVLTLLLTGCNDKILLKNISNIDFHPMTPFDSPGYKPIITSNKKLIISSGSNDNGLKIYNTESKQSFQLNELNGAGTRFFMDRNEENIVFQTYSLKDNRKYNSIVKMGTTKESTPFVIEEGKRNLKFLSVLSDNAIYLQDDKIYSKNLTNGKKVENPEGLTIAYSDNDLNLIVFKDGKQYLLDPIGKGNYIWVSISPDFKNILFHKAEKGTFVCDLNGQNIVELGKINNPKWVGKDNWIIGTEENDDGHKYLSSDIILINLMEGKRINITENTDLIALNPCVSTKFDQLVFNDEKGILYISELKDLKNK